MVNQKRVIQFKTPVYVEERGTAVVRKKGVAPSVMDLTMYFLTCYVERRIGKQRKKS